MHWWKLGSCYGTRRLFQIFKLTSALSFPSQTHHCFILPLDCAAVLAGEGPFLLWKPSIKENLKTYLKLNAFMQKHVVWSQIFSPRMSCPCFVPSPKPKWTSQFTQSDVQQAGLSYLVIVALVTEGQTCSGALSENELIQKTQIMSHHVTMLSDLWPENHHSQNYRTFWVARDLGQNLEPFQYVNSPALLCSFVLLNICVILLIPRPWAGAAVLLWALPPWLSWFQRDIPPFLTLSICAPFHNAWTLTQSTPWSFNAEIFS